MLKRLSLYTLLLCCVPFFAWIINWHWRGAMEYQFWDQWLYGITETGSSPYALLTCAVFALAYFVCLRNKKQALFVIGVMAVSVGVTQGLKSGLKVVFAEPRPFISEMAEKTGVSVEHFYDQDKVQRKQIVLDYYATQPNEPAYLVAHRGEETSYSFPSGHSIFAATWLMLAVGFGQLLGRNNKGMRWLTAGITLWAVLMLISRLRLGMHYPVDVLVSVLIAWLFHCVLFALLPRWRIFQPKNQ